MRINRLAAIMSIEIRQWWRSRGSGRGSTALPAPKVSSRIALRRAWMPCPLDSIVDSTASYQSYGARLDWITEAGDFHHKESSMPSKILTLRHQAFILQHGRCWYCDVRMWRHSPEELGKSLRKSASGLQCTAEHLLPQSEGGRDHAGNIVAACMHCNRTRHKRKRPPTPEAYQADVRRRVARGRWHPAWVRTLGLL